MNGGHETIVASGEFVRHEPKEPVLLLRPEHLPGGHIPLPASDMSDSLCFRQTRLAKLEGVFSLFASGDVPQNSRVKLPLVCFPRREGELDRKFRAIFSQSFELDRLADDACFPSGFEARYRLAVHAVIPLRNNGVEWFPDCLLFIIAKNCFGCGIPKNDVSTVIRRDNRVAEDRKSTRLNSSHQII